MDIGTEKSKLTGLPSLQSALALVFPVVVGYKCVPNCKTRAVNALFQVSL